MPRRRSAKRRSVRRTSKRRSARRSARRSWWANLKSVPAWRPWAFGENQGVHGPFGPEKPGDDKELLERLAEIAAIDERNLASLNVHQRPLPGRNPWIGKGQNGNVVYPSYIRAEAERREKNRAGKKSWW